MTRISVLTTWVCATGVAVVTAYSVYINHKNVPKGRARAAEVAKHIAKRGTIAEFKREAKHSSAVRKTTEAKVAETKEEKVPTYVPNPIYPPFTNALENMSRELVEATKEEDVVLSGGVIASQKDGKPTFIFPEAYGAVKVGGIAIGEELVCGQYSVRRKNIPETDQYIISGIGMSRWRKLDEPEFYCTSVTYSALPVTKQVDSISMRGDLKVETDSKAADMVAEVTKWMQDDFGAVELNIKKPDDMLALKRFRIGDGMDAEVRVNWKKCLADDGTDAFITVDFKATEFTQEHDYQSEELGKATDIARDEVFTSTGINYFSVTPKVNEESVARKVVY